MGETYCIYIHTTYIDNTPHSLSPLSLPLAPFGGHYSYIQDVGGGYLSSLS